MKRTLTASLLTNSIRQLRDEYLKGHLALSLYEINNGLCEKFASDILKNLGGYNDDYNFMEVENACFMIGEDGAETENDIWDSELLGSYWDMKPPYNLTWEDLNSISFGTHVWITFNKRHYDAECSEGVDNFFELPLFKRYIALYCEEKGILTSEVIVN